MLVVEEPGLQLFRFTGINCKLNLEHGFTVLERDLFLGHPIKLTSYPKIRTNKSFGGDGDREHILGKSVEDSTDVHSKNSTKAMFQNLCQQCMNHQYKMCYVTPKAHTTTHQICQFTKFTKCKKAGFSHSRAKN